MSIIFCLSSPFAASNPSCTETNPITSQPFVRITPRIILQGGPPTYFRAVLAATFTVTDEDGDQSGWHTVCAPLGPLLSNGSLPVPSATQNGTWYIGGAPCDYTAGVNCVGTITGIPSNEDGWCPALWSDIRVIALPIDPTPNPAVGIYLGPFGCTLYIYISLKD